MFRRMLLAAVLVLSAFLFSCAGEDGATGPAGKAGEDGNANVVIYEYGTQTTTTGTLIYDFAATQGFVDSCLALGYYQEAGQGTNWYPIPGLGPVNSYMTRSYLTLTDPDPGAYTYYVRLVVPNGSAYYLASTTFTRLKLILVPASVIIPVTSRGLLNLSDYDSVADYLELSE